jgi:hypothetical protein
MFPGNILINNSVTPMQNPEPSKEFSASEWTPNLEPNTLRTFRENSASP